MRLFKLLKKFPNTNSKQRELLLRIDHLEAQLERLLKEKENLMDRERPAIVIQNVERVIVEKLEHTNHFGTLEIQDLAGKLNIGLNLTAPIPEDIKNSLSEKLQKSQPSSPRYTIRPRANK